VSEWKCEYAEGEGQELVNMTEMGRVEEGGAKGRGGKRGDVRGSAYASGAGPLIVLIPAVVIGYWIGLSLVSSNQIVCVGLHSSSS
jgi:hypothetical protein